MGFTNNSFIVFVMTIIPTEIAIFPLQMYTHNTCTGNRKTIGRFCKHTTKQK